MKAWPFFLGMGLALYALCVPLDGYAQESESPTKIYQAYHEALQRLDMKGIRALWLPQETIAGDEEALMKEILRMRQITPPEIEVQGEKIIGTDAFLTVLGYYPNGGKSKGKIYLMKKIDEWKVREEEWGFIELPSSPPIPKGEGVIEGFMTLPSVEKKGDLYVLAVLANQDKPTGFTVIPKDKIAWQLVPYRIPDLPPGTYWVYAYWDTALPYMDPLKWDFSVSTGDYAGEFPITVTLKEKETRSRIDFSCSRDFKAKEEENYGKNYSFVDIGVSADASRKTVLLLGVRNTGYKPVRSVSLLCKINGKELTYASSSPVTMIPPNGVREFDITTCYDSYLFFLDKIWTKENLSKNQLKFEILSKDNDAHFEKEIVVE